MLDIFSLPLPLGVLHRAPSTRVRSQLGPSPCLRAFTPRPRQPIPHASFLTSIIQFCRLCICFDLEPFFGIALLFSPASCFYTKSVHRLPSSSYTTPHKRIYSFNGATLSVTGRQLGSARPPKESHGFSVGCNEITSGARHYSESENLIPHYTPIALYTNYAVEHPICARSDRSSRIKSPLPARI